MAIIRIVRVSLRLLIHVILGSTVRKEPISSYAMLGIALTILAIGLITVSI